MLPDILHAILVVLKVEDFRRKKNYSHTLLVNLVLAAIVFFISNSIIYAFFVLSHFVFDLVNRREMYITPWGGKIKGLGLHDRGICKAYYFSYFLEIFLVTAAVVIYGLSQHSAKIASILLVGMIFLDIVYYKVYRPEG